MCFTSGVFFFNAPDYFWFEVGRVRDVSCFFSFVLFRLFMFFPRFSNLGKICNWEFES